MGKMCKFKLCVPWWQDCPLESWNPVEGYNNSLIGLEGFEDGDERKLGNDWYCSALLQPFTSMTPVKTVFLKESH